MAQDIRLNSPCMVISQPMYFPWAGMFEQIKFSDIFIHYEDVQFSRGSFSNRVQVKTASGIRWLTVPLQNFHVGQSINQVEINNKKNWRRSHLDTLKQIYSAAPYKLEMFRIVDEVFSGDYKILSELSKASMRVLIDYFRLNENRIFIESSSLPIRGKGTQRVLDLCLYLKAKTYLTGHGAQNYLKHELFESFDIDVVYILYGLQAYPQCYRDFTPYVSVLDLVANCGKEGIAYLAGDFVSWKEFIQFSKH